MKVQIKYFASIREAVGSGAESLETAATTVAALRDELVDQDAAAGAWVRHGGDFWTGRRQFASPCRSKRSRSVSVSPATALVRESALRIRSGGTRDRKGRDIRVLGLSGCAPMGLDGETRCRSSPAEPGSSPR